MSVTDGEGFANSILARSIRCIVLRARRKWKVLKRASPARVANGMCSTRCSRHRTRRRASANPQGLPGPAIGFRIRQDQGVQPRRPGERRAPRGRVDRQISGARSTWRAWLPYPGARNSQRRPAEQGPLSRHRNGFAVPGHQKRHTGSRSNARFLPLPIFMIGRHERELPCKVSQRASGHTLNEHLRCPPQTAVVNSEQMDGRIKAAFDPVMREALD
jgi:hypothetical protein